METDRASLTKEFEGKLPAGWAVEVDPETSKLFFFCEATGRYQMEHPNPNRFASATLTLWQRAERLTVCVWRFSIASARMQDGASKNKQGKKPRSSQTLIAALPILDPSLLPLDERDGHGSVSHPARHVLAVAWDQDQPAKANLLRTYARACCPAMRVVLNQHG